MKTCIICKEPKKNDEFNIEHVIPDSAGGTYTINNVCKDCNNFLGSTVDYDFLKNPLIKVLLIHHDIRNKKGKLPRLFKKSLQSLNSKIKGKPIYNDRTGKLEKIKYETSTEFIDNTFHLKYDSLEPIEDILNEIELEDKYKKEIMTKIESEEYKEEKFNFKYMSEVSVESIIIESLKIAYEFANDMFKLEYLDDELGQNIRKVLNYPKMFGEMKLKQIPLLDFEINKVQLDDVKHLITLSKTKNHIIAQVMLLNYITTTFIISNNAKLFKKDYEMSIVIDFWGEKNLIKKNLKSNEIPHDEINLSKINLEFE